MLFSDPLRSPSFWYRQAIYFDLKAHPTSLVSTVIIDDNCWIFRTFCHSEKTQPESPNQYYMIERFGRSSWVELYIKRVYLLLASLCISISSIVKILWVFWVVVPGLYDSKSSKNNAKKTSVYMNIIYDHLYDCIMTLFKVPTQTLGSQQNFHGKHNPRNFHFQKSWWINYESSFGLKSPPTTWRWKFAC